MEWTARRAPDSGLVYGAARDVTHHHDAQAALRANEAWLHAIVDHSTAAIFVKDRAQRYVLVNEVFLRAFGFAREDVLGKTARQIWPDAPTDEAEREVLDRGVVVTHDEVIELGDDTQVMMVTRFPLLDSAGAVSGVAAIATDISEWTRVRAALAERQRLLDTVIRACPDIVTVLDGNGTVREISEASAHPRIRPPSTPSRRRSRRSSIPMTSTGSTWRRPRSSRARHATRPDLPRPPCRRPLGRARHAGQAMVGDDGSTVGAVVVSRDVTDELEVEAEMHVAMESAEQAEQGQERLPVPDEPRTAHPAQQRVSASPSSSRWTTCPTSTVRPSDTSCGRAGTS